MKYLLKSLLYAGSLLFSFLMVKLSRYATSLLPFLSAFDAGSITDMICAIVPFFAGITVEFFKARKEKELLIHEHEHQFAMQAEAHKAAIAEIEKNAALAQEKQRLAWEREDRAAEEAKRQKRFENFRGAYSSMINAVSEYMNKHDVNFKTDAEKAVRNFRSFTNGGLCDQVNALLSVISRSDAFDGPNQRSVEEILASIKKYLPDQSADHKEEYDHQYSF